MSIAMIAAILPAENYVWLVLGKILLGINFRVNLTEGKQ